MKKKLLVIALMVVMAVFAFVISASAVEIDGIYYSLTTSENGNTAALTNENKNCALEVVNIPETITVDGVTYTVTSLWSEAFSGSSWPGNKTVKKITIPKTVSSIGTHCFRNCTSLEEVYIKGTAKSFSNAEFYNCTSLWKLDMSGMTEEVTIGQYFAYGTAISDLKLPPKLKKISGTTPFKTSALTNLVLPDSLTWLGDYAFQNCTNINTVKLSANLEYFGCNNFQNSKITEIIIPSKVTQVTKDTFHGSSLKKVVFASTSVTSYNANMFSSTGSLNLLFYPASTEAEAKTFTANFGTRFDGWTYIHYDNYNPETTYTKTIVYGTKNCSVCSNIIGDAVTTATDLVSDIYSVVECTACGAKTSEKLYDAPIVYLGYSKRIGGGGQICIGYKVNEEALAEYEKLTKKTITYGVVAYVPKANEARDTLEPINSDLTLKDPDSTIFASAKGYHSFEFVIRGFDSEETREIELIMCAYVSDGSEVSYLGINQETNTVSQTEYATLVTFNGFED